MFRKIHSPGKKSPPPMQGGGSGWLAGMLAGQILGFAAALLIVAPLPVLLVSTLAGGVLGVLAEAKVKGFFSKRRPANDNPRRAYAFEALPQTDSKLGELFIEEDFNGAADSDSRGLKEKPAPKPQLAPAAPMPPRMRGF